MDVLRPFLEADYDRVCIVQVTDRTDNAFFSWWTDEVRPARTNSDRSTNTPGTIDPRRRRCGTLANAVILDDRD